MVDNVMLPTVLNKATVLTVLWNTKTFYLQPDLKQLITMLPRMYSAGHVGIFWWQLYLQIQKGDACCVQNYTCNLPNHSSAIKMGMCSVTSSTHLFFPESLSPFCSASSIIQYTVFALLRLTLLIY